MVRTVVKGGPCEDRLRTHSTKEGHAPHQRFSTRRRPMRLPHWRRWQPKRQQGERRGVRCICSRRRGRGRCLGPPGPHKLLLWPRHVSSPPRYPSSRVEPPTPGDHPLPHSCSRRRSFPPGDSSRACLWPRISGTRAQGEQRARLFLRLIPEHSRSRGRGAGRAGESSSATGGGRRGAVWNQSTQSCSERTSFAKEHCLYSQRVSFFVLTSIT